MFPLIPPSGPPPLIAIGGLGWTTLYVLRYTADAVLLYTTFDMPTGPYVIAIRGLGWVTLYALRYTADAI